MNKNTFHGRSLEECINNACSSLNISSEKIDYEIIEKKGLLRKSITIKVLNDIKSKDYIEELNIQEKINVKEKELIQENSKDGFLRIENGNLIIEDPKQGGRVPVLLIPDNIEVKVNDEILKGMVELKKENKVEIKIPKETAKRNLDITLSEKDMKAYITVSYYPEKIYKLKDCENNNKIMLELDIKETNFPPKFTKEEVLKELQKASINYGILQDEFDKESFLNSDGEYILVAQGTEPINEEEDRINIKFNVDKKKFQEDDKGNIDYRNIGSIDMVKKGEIIGELIQGNVGKDGKNVKGKIIPCLRRKKIIFKAGNGCEQKTNYIYSTIDGKPNFKGGVFHVNPVYEIDKDIDISTGNIEYSGDVCIKGQVKEGMKIDVGGNVKITQNTTYASIKAQGNIEIEGNILSSQVYAGGSDNDILTYVNLLSGLKDQLNGLIESIVEVKKFGIVNEYSTDGQILKALIESKFKKIPKLCMKLITTEYTNLKLKSFLTGKLMYLAPLNIKHFNEIDDIIKCITLEIEDYSEKVSIPAYVSLEYCQDSTIKSTGDIYIIGKGQYVSDITSNGIIEFKKEGAISRGGSIIAKNEIRAQEVGSVAGVNTILKVEKKGHIYAKKAYGNTTFIIGNKECTLDCECNNVHAYMDSFGEVIVDKIKA